LKAITKEKNNAIKTSNDFDHFINPDSTPLINALFEGETLINQNPQCIFDQDTDCQCPALCFASEVPNSFSLIKVMVEKGVDPNLECNCGKLPLDAALFSYYQYKEDLTKVKFFLERIKRVDPVHPKPISTHLVT
jgi:hypothetical protein